MDEEEAVDDSPPPWEGNFIEQMIELRTAKMSQTELARQLSGRGLPFHQQTVQRIEKGERPLRLNEAHAIAEILGTDPWEMARPVTDDEQELQKIIGDLQHVSQLTVETGLRWKRDWDRERHRLRITMAKLREQLGPTEEKMQLILQQGQQLIEDTDKVDELLMECYRKLARVITGQENSLIRSQAFDPVTRQDYTFTVVPWSPGSILELPGAIDWTRRNDEADVVDDIDFD